jgi:hypothetical protein
MKRLPESNHPLLLQLFPGVSVMALLVLTAVGNALLMLVVAFGLLIVGLVVFRRELLSPGALAPMLLAITASAIELLWLFRTR